MTKLIFFNVTKNVTPQNKHLFEAKRKNANFDELKSQIVTNLKKVNCDKPPHSNCNNFQNCVKKKSEIVTRTQT